MCRSCTEAGVPHHEHQSDSGVKAKGKVSKVTDRARPKVEQEPTTLYIVGMYVTVNQGSKTWALTILASAYQLPLQSPVTTTLH